MSERPKGGFLTRLIRNEPVSPSCCILRIERPQHFPEALPGQFVSVRLPDRGFPLLRRPYSIFDLTDEEIILLVKTAGTGSSLLTHLRPGEMLDLIGPLGGSTFARPRSGDALFIAGGTGIAPLVYLARVWKRSDLQVKSYLLYGAVDERELLADLVVNDFSTVHFATLDGSKGFHGDVVSLCEELLSKGHIPTDHCYSCGPREMIEVLVKRVGEHFGEHETSLETIMACGVGACRGCTVPVIESGHIALKAVCSDGTVFNAGTVVWTEWKA